MAKDSIQAYLELTQTRPELFTPSPDIPLVLDEQRIRDFSARMGRPMGVTMDNLPYWCVLTDLCQRGAQEFAYSRVIYPNPTNGSVAIPVMGEKFGLLRSFRHAPRCELLEFPRGFAQADKSPEELIRMELAEELQAQVARVQFLGQVRADSGLTSGCAQVFLAELTHAEAAVGHEGIREALWLSKKELKHCIRQGKITDGFTLSALALLWAQGTD